MWSKISTKNLQKCSNFLQKLSQKLSKLCPKKTSKNVIKKIPKFDQKPSKMFNILTKIVKKIK